MSACAIYGGRGEAVWRVADGVSRGSRAVGGIGVRVDDEKHCLLFDSYLLSSRDDHQLEIMVCRLIAERLLHCKGWSFSQSLTSCF